MLDLQQGPAHSFAMTKVSLSRTGRTRPRALRRQLTTLSVLALLCLPACDRSEVDEGGGIPTVAYGARITFGLNGNSEPLKGFGWSKTEEKFTWSEGTTAVLRMRVAATTEPVRLKMKMAALVKEPELSFQPVEVDANGQKIAEWQVGDAAEFTTKIPGAITRAGGELVITFKIPKATSPKALGVNEDPRILGICCLEMELSKG